MLHTSYFVCVAWWRRSTTQQAAALRRLYNFLLYTSYFILRNTMRGMVEPQQAAALRYFAFHQKHRDIIINPPITKGGHIVGDGLDGDIGGVVAVLVHHVA